ncbi:uncharacterized protein PHACADRAFT_257143 [Phanerochaete carnosa HHB-10118-sp]|uniref:Uncharacterized protein n=1 Tax=Phanerochaete carnosa (strain HHB-10118-sp) TaxID=650164 RepID=K5WZY0_PHACS|nr:uncharacterized protein PHACADRAFT_257143 [Phanerochaete carnosa HHB-10118-sp]EKM56082.1 hypothetical protein PHACADRAFT_257143 [Phanerochaete carnosa HHB-10118-sp]
MSNSTVPADPAVEVPLFQGRLPLLVEPAVIIMLLCLMCSPTKSRIDQEKSKLGSFFTRSWALVAAVQLINVFYTILIYERHDGAFLTLDTPSSVSDKTVPGVRPVMFSVLFAMITVFYAQVGMTVIYSQASRGRSFKIRLALFALAVLGFGWTGGSWISFGRLWPGRTFVEELEWMMLGQIFSISFDVLMYVALCRLHREADADRQPQLSRLISIAYVTIQISVVLMSLRGFGMLFRMPCNGWLDYTFKIGGGLITWNIHLLSFFLMWIMIEGDTQVAAGAGNLASESDPIAAAKDTVTLIDV